jgi:hypothetical protein
MAAVSVTASAIAILMTETLFSRGSLSRLVFPAIGHRNACKQKDQRSSQRYDGGLFHCSLLLKKANMPT